MIRLSYLRRLLQTFKFSVIFLPVARVYQTIGLLLCSLNFQLIAIGRSVLLKGKLMHMLATSIGRCRKVNVAGNNHYL